MEDVAAEYGRAAQVVYGNQNTFTRVLGETSNFPSVRDWPVVSGVFVSDDDLKRRTRVAVLGQTVAKALFGETDPIGARVKINRTTFTVIGIMETKGTTRVPGSG